MTAKIVETDRRNDLALLRISSTKMSSAETKSLISKLGIKVATLIPSLLIRDLVSADDIFVEDMRSRARSFLLSVSTILAVTCLFALSPTVTSLQSVTMC